MVKLVELPSPFSIEPPEILIEFDFADYLKNPPLLLVGQLELRGECELDHAGNLGQHVGNAVLHELDVLEHLG
jgi:hypothetical protein